MRWRDFRFAHCTIWSSPLPKGEIDALTEELLARVPQPEKFMELRVEGGEIRLRYRDIIRAEHFAHVIYVHTTAGKTLATRQSFKAFTAPLKEDPRFFVCGRGVIVNLEHAEDFEDAAFRMEDGSRVFVSQELQKAHGSPLWNICWKGAHVMKAALRPVLELLVVFPGLLLAYFPVRSYLNQSPGRLAARLLPLMAGACVGGGLLCLRFQCPTEAAQAVLALAATLIYIKNAAYFPLEIGNYRPECMRGIRLHQQHLSRRQRGAPDLRAGSMAGAVALPERGHFLQRGLLAVHSGGVLPIHPRCTHDGGGRPFRADVVCVLGTAPDIYPAQYRYDPHAIRQRSRPGVSYRSTSCSASRC